ncbi:hypothetical protein I3500192B8_16690 [Acidaminococcus intestini]|uniref:hypothetical protein n=1 Tax=Acidaminococcus intestini TaxID=187327 RepID=UPI0036F29D60
MAQLTLTLSQEELLVLLSGDRKNAFREMVQNLFNIILQPESQQYLNLPLMNALKSARTAVMDLANVPILPRIGVLFLTVPRHRNVPFKTLLFTN